MFGIEYDFLDISKMNSDIHIKRAGGHTTKAALGQVFLGDSNTKFCYSLEDVIRGTGIKVDGETGIPAGIYNWHITMSTRFKREMISIYTESNGYELKADGKSFIGIRMHGGNDVVDSHGCPLVAYNKTAPDKIQGTAEKELLVWAKSVGSKGKVFITN